LTNRFLKHVLLAALSDGLNAFCHGQIFRYSILKVIQSEALAFLLLLILSKNLSTQIKEERYMHWPDRVEELLAVLSWKAGNLTYYEQALTHSSYAYEKGHQRLHNERLEFLGDAVLELIISDYLYNKYHNIAEGKLTKLRADLVCEASLARLAFDLNLGQYLRLGKGEIYSGGFSRPSLLADAVEALIGANYLDQGLEKCRQNVLDIFNPILQDLQEGVIRRDYKTLLQEFTQARYAVTPIYRIIRESGPDHDKTFEAEVLLSSEPVGAGAGHSKKEAEQAAAKEAWNLLTP
jgi:ribonuclease III